MLWILIGLIACALVMVILFFRSKKQDPEETEESSERIVYMKDYKPIWRKQVK